MLFLFKLFSNILKVLNSEESPSQLAAGFSFGAWIGLMPLQGLVPTLFVFISFLININMGFLAVAALLFKLIAFAVDPLANQLGYFLLTKIPALHPFWTQLYNMPAFPYTRFNNTIVLGSFVIGLLLLVPNYWLGLYLVSSYRTHLKAKVERWKIMKFIKASSFYKYYESYRGITGQ